MAVKTSFISQQAMLNDNPAKATKQQREDPKNELLTLSEELLTEVKVKEMISKCLSIADL
jgi:hypothetical protein